MTTRNHTRMTLTVVDGTPLPGQVLADTELVDSVAANVRRTYTAGGLMTLLAVGKVVLDALYGGSYDKFAAVGRAHASFRALAARRDIGISASSLWYAVALHENVLLLGRDDAQRIPLSQHRMLVHVRDPAARVELARRTIAEHWTVKQLEALIPPRQVVVPGKRLRGRPAMAPAVKAFHELRRAVEELPTVTAEAMQGESLEDGARLRGEEVEQLRQAIDAWLVSLEARLVSVAAQDVSCESF